MLQKEGQVRIPAGCAISGIFHKDGTRENGTRIIDSIRTDARSFQRPGRRLRRLRHLP